MVRCIAGPGSGLRRDNGFQYQPMYDYNVHAYIVWLSRDCFVCKLAPLLIVVT